MPRAEIHPYSRLSPDRIIAAVETLGLACDGRVLALNSYENRVYQVGVEDAEPVVVKFYRPGRWSRRALLEEHSFAAELAAVEVPVVAPLRDARRDAARSRGVSIRGLRAQGRTLAGARERATNA